MRQEALKIKAHLVKGKEKIPIDAKYNSKYSALIQFLDTNRFIGGTEFSRLVIQVNGERFELGPCQLISAPNIDGYDGRLIFIDDVYDLQRLFSDGRIVKLQNAFVNLPLLLAHKGKTKQSFKDYTADLTYDLNVYKNLFDELDAEYSEEPKDIQESIQRAIIDTEGRKFMHFLDEKLHELEQMVADFSKEEHERHGFYFRRQLWNIIMCSPFTKRTNLKPRGYSGDSEMMRMIYSNDYEGESTFSNLMHKHPLEQPAAEAVRNRRKLIVRMLSNIQNDSPVLPQEKLKVLSVACGAAIEMKDILLSPEDCEKYHFTLLDQDRSALYEAATLVDQMQKNLGAKIEVDYLNASVRTMLATRQLIKEWGQFDFIYSMGLFDYLTPPVATVVLGRLYQLLKPGGDMLIGNFHVSNPSRTYMEYWNDWVIYYRTEEEFVDLLRDVSSMETSISFEDTECQMFLHVKKTG